MKELRNNNKKKRIINIIGKILVVLFGCGSMLIVPLFILVDVYLKWLFNIDKSEILGKLTLPLMLTGLVLGFVGAIMFALTEERVKKTPKYKADRYKIIYNNYDKLYEYLKSNIMKENYGLLIHKELNDNISLSIYCKKYLLTAEFITIIKVEDLKENQIKEINDEHDICYFEYIEENFIKHVYDTFLIIDSKENEIFLDYLNTPVSQHINTYSINLGISLDKKKLYISKPDCELGIAKYYKLRKKVIKAINFNELIKHDNN